jgi:hypothetical protein
MKFKQLLKEYASEIGPGGTIAVKPNVGPTNNELVGQKISRGILFKLKQISAQLAQIGIRYEDFLVNDTRTLDIVEQAPGTYIVTSDKGAKLKAVAAGTNFIIYDAQGNRIG